ncbi:MAG: hypothetical protein IIT41_04315 [Oscillospiraceae bacterium]|nr:hypothetical protein [Oscillospiraceae bacterium]
MASRVFQSMVVQMKEATTRMIGVVDSEGNVIASSDLNLMGAHIVESFELAAILSEKTAAIGGRTYKTLGSSDVNFDYAVFVEGTDEIASSFAVMAAIAVSSAKTYYEEKYDREKNYPHHAAITFHHNGRLLFEVFKFIGVELSEIEYNHPAGVRYPSENPFC